MNIDADLEVLEKYLLRIPGMNASIAKGHSKDGLWWVRFVIDINHHLAWHVVQELGYVLNGLSLNERLPTVFKPMSPPPYLNGGPEDFLSWAIESQDANFTPALCAKWLEGRLPRPVEDLMQWAQEE